MSGTDEPRFGDIYRWTADSSLPPATIMAICPRSGKSWWCLYVHTESEDEAVGTMSTWTLEHNRNWEKIEEGLDSL